MSIKHLLRRTAAVLGLTLSVVQSAAAQGLPSSVSEPEFVPYVEDLQLFEQPDLSPYGRGVQPPQGWFGSVEFINFTVGAPGDSSIGNTDVTVQQVYGRSTYTTTTGTLTHSQVTGGTLVAVPPAPVGSLPAGTVSNDAIVPPGSSGNMVNSYNQFNSNENTFSADWTSGSRFEFGRINDGLGWFVSTFTLGTQTQDNTLSDVSMNFANQPVGFVDIVGAPGTINAGQTNPSGFVGDGFDDDLDNDGVYGRFGRDRGVAPGFGNPLDGIPDVENIGMPSVPIDWDDAVTLPTIFSSIITTNRTGVWGVETNRMYRLDWSPRGGVWELFVGPRYLNVDDSYSVTAIARNTNPTYYQNPLGDSFWNTDAQNNILAGQFGGRWSFQRERWQVSVETRLFAGVNFQNVQQQGGFGSLNDTVVPPQTGAVGANTIPRRDDVVNMQLPASFQSQVNLIEFSPGMEMRFNLKYQVFRSVYLQLGYTAMYAENIARASKMVQYTLPGMGINSDNNKEGLFMNGVNFGVVINR